MLVSDTVDKTLQFILTHLEEPCRGGEISHAVGLSFSRLEHLFSAEMGEGIESYIRHKRMEASALRLQTEPETRITDLAQDYGYSSSNYSTAFRSHFQASPAEYKKTLLKKRDNQPITLRLETTKPIRVIHQRFVGGYAGFSASWELFIESHKDLITNKTIFIDCSYDSPAIADPSHCLYDTCIIAPDDYSAKKTTTIGSKRCLVYRYTGNKAGLSQAHQAIIEAIAQSSYRLTTGYPYERYRSVDCLGDHYDLDICFPVE